MTPARVLFTRTRYDFDESLVDPVNPPVRLTRPGVAAVEIIASSETGVAGWLADHGQSVVAPEAPASRVADEIGAAFDRARRRPGSLPDLPALDQRIVADRWMFTGAVP